ncbi:hypothetical protein [Bacillus sp. 7884-1]|uniref:hypothetical protein n=1 Tax=Bacillus sp. 7884-1 TaxID=2021693 RepID=UPI000BA6EA45|nr:hypothetical protein [Bacillus sp. 7884-1]PAE33344.1 hypothetical protein CHI06_25985 [Bacillus sp. 7884-1]
MKEDQLEKVVVYRGIKLADSVKLFNRKGEYILPVKIGLDKLADILEECNFIMLDVFAKDKGEVRFVCEFGHLYIRTPKKMKYDNFCPNCSKNEPDRMYRGIKLGNSVKLYKKDGEFNKQVKQGLDKLADKLEKNNHLLLSEFVNNTTKITIDYRCGHKPGIAFPNNYTRDEGCYECGIESAKKKSHEKSEPKFRKMLEENNHKLLTEYKGTKAKVVIDFNCGHKPHEISPGNYMMGKRCPKCRNMCPEQAIEKLNEILIKNGDEWIEGEYINTHTKIKIKFNCDHEANWITPAHYKDGMGCYDCGLLITTMAAQERSELAKKEFEELVKRNGHQLLSEYKSATEKVLIHYNCKHDAHSVSPNAYKTHNVYCPLCKVSKGEKIIQDWLEENGIEYEAQFKFPKQKKGRFGYKYDFMLPNQNSIIEVHGLQHYEHCYYHEVSSKTLEKEQENDRLKLEYAESMGCNYIVVDYREHNPELALQRFIKQYTDLIERKNKLQKV